MGTYTAAINNQANNDTEYRVMIAAMRAAIASSGLVQTADTGQIDPATTIKPGVANAVSGYEMYRFADALQSTKPVFIKVEYGVGNPTNYFSYYLTVGIATNGAGTLTGSTITSRRQMTSALGGSVVRNWYASGGTNRIMVVVAYNPAAVSMGGFIIERLLDDLGNPVGDGVVVALMHENLSHWGILVHGLAPDMRSGESLPAIGIGLGGHLPNIGADLALSPHFFAIGKWRYWRPLAYRTSDLTDLQQFTIDHLGGPKTYLPMRFFNTAFTATPNSGMSIALPWE